MFRINDNNKCRYLDAFITLQSTYMRQKLRNNSKVANVVEIPSETPVSSN